MAKRLSRDRLDVEVGADVIRHPSKYELVLRMDEGGDIDVSWMDDIDNASELAKELNLFLSKQASGTGKRSVANTCLQYIRYVAALGGYVGVQSLRGFRKELDSKSCCLNTKYQVFNVAKSFVNHLMAANALAHDDLPPSFDREEVSHKPTFIEVVRSKLHEYKEKYSEEIAVARDAFSLDEMEALALVVGDVLMQKIEKAAEEQCLSTIQDWRFVDSVIGELNEDDLKALRAIEKFGSLKDKSISLAISILYAQYGYSLPAATKWPHGLVDYCKRRGWTGKRLQGAFFPVAKTLDSFLVLALANRELMPNVDSVAFYAYTDCCKPADEVGKVSVHLGKKRGAAITENMPDDESVVVALDALSRRVMSLLHCVPNGDYWLRQEFIPAMLHSTDMPSIRDQGVKCLDRGMPSYMVKRFIKDLAKEDADLLALVDSATGENFRPTHAYLRKLQGESIYSIKLKLHHKNISTTDGYIKGVETTSLQHKKHQDYQNFIVSKAKASRVIRTGSGYMCDTASADKPDCIDIIMCHECKANRVVFDVPEIVAEWLAWEECLLLNMNRLKSSNPERWESVWEMKLVEYQAFISGAKSVTLKKARKLAEAVVLPPID